MHGFRFVLLTAFLAFGMRVDGTTSVVSELTIEPRFKEVAMALHAVLPEEHLTHRPVDDEMSERAWRNYFRSLDPMRLYLMEPDVERFEDKQLVLDDELRVGNVEFAFEVFDLLRDRVRDRVEFIEEQLAKGFDLTLDEAYEWDRGELPWAKNREEWDTLWRKSLKNQYLQAVIKKKSAEEDKENGEEGEGSDEEQDEGSDEDEGEDNGEEQPAKPSPSPEETILKRYRRIREVLDHSDAESVLQRYLTAVTLAYDPHCTYMSPISKENFDISMKLSLVGIGALLTQEDGALKIEKILPGGPADRDERDIKLVPGDKIIAVGQGDEERVDIIHWPMTKAIQLIRGEKETKVVLEVISASDPTESTTRLVDLIRDEIKLEERAAKYEVEEYEDEDGETNRFGVIDLPAFYADLAGAADNPDNYKSCARDVGDILKSIRTNDVDGVILDLRSNGGGSLREVAIMTGHFIPRGPIVQVRQIRDISVLPDKNPEILYGGPLIVLVNRLSASASEILAAALQDYGRALIVGDSHTFGKGTVQGVKPLAGNRELGSIKITNALFYRISGGSTQLKGVSSDIVVPSASESMEVGECFRDYAMDWTSVRRLPYRPLAQLTPAVRKLMDDAEVRRAADARFASYTNILAKIEELNDVVEMPLQLDKRLERYHERQRLSEAQKEIAEGNGGRLDIVLEETMAILADFVDLHPQRTE